MTPETITAVGTIAKLIDLIQGWPLWLILVAIVLGPWLTLIWMSAASDKRIAAIEKAASDRAAAHELQAEKNLAELRKISEAGWDAYRDNAELVKATQEIARKSFELAEQLAEIVHLNTQTQQQLVDAIRHNVFCPTVRKLTGKE